jgi:hypothetical protein
MNLIAENSDGTIGIYITEKNGDPNFIVENNDDIIDEDMAFSKVDCEETVRELYSEYLSYDELDISADTDIKKEIIADRENQITVLFENFLFDLLPDTDEDTISEITDDVKEHILEYIARKHGLPVYRPMYLEDEDGEDFFSEYPYEEMIFEDCNPIYDPN